MKLHVSIAILMLAVFSSNANAQQPKAHINHVAIYVVDLQKAGNFYMNILGLDSIPEPFHDGKHIWLRIGPGSAMHIIQGAETKKEYYKNDHTCFSVASVVDFTEKLKQNSIPFEDVSGKQMAISSRVDGIKQIWLRDPDGYWLEINDAKD